MEIRQRRYGYSLCHECMEDKHPGDMAERHLCKSCRRKQKQRRYREQRYKWGLKPCLGECGGSLPFSEFFDKPTAADGLESICKDCKKARREAEAPPSPMREKRRMVEEDSTQICKGECGRTLDLLNFEKDAKGVGGRRSVCKDCRRDQRKARAEQKRRALAALIECWCCHEEYPAAVMVEVEEETHECPDCFAENEAEIKKNEG